MAGLDAFLNELFPSPQPPAAAPFVGAEPAGPSVGGMTDPTGALAKLAGLLKGGASLPSAGGDDGGMLPQNSAPASGVAPPGIPMVNPPLPRPRPMDAPQGTLADELGAAGAASGIALPAPAATDGAQPSPDTASPFARLAGMVPKMRPPAGDADRGLLGNMFGLDASGTKRALSSLAGGMEGGNANFKLGAAMKGAGGALKGGLKSNKEDAEAETASDERTQKQSNFERTQGDKEKTSDALRKLYGARADNMGLTNRATANAFNYQPGTDANGTQGAWKISKLDGSREFVPGMVLTNRTGGATRGKAWDKPPEQRYSDAMRLIQNERKAINGALPIGANKADRDAAAAQLDAFKGKTLKAYGIDENGNDTSAPPAGGKRGAVPSSLGVVGDQEGQDSGLYDSGPRGDAIGKAREALARGANRDQVMERLKQNGYGDVAADELM